MRVLNQNLEQQAQTYFQELFVDKADPAWHFRQMVRWRPDDPSQIAAGEKYTYTVVVSYNGEEIRREKWSFVFNEIADPITNSTITVTKEG
ncbi:MAG TPA: hypothetical protein H9799_00715 [Candidatus Mediterraneibacter merdipullorum]|nr:hypothetical protein [Candidatus Mediterraneibacter merdipullorum]